MELWFLKADEPLTKQFTLEPDGTYSKTTYPNAFRVTSANIAVETVGEFNSALTMFAKENYCLLKGPLDGPVINESRAGRTKTEEPTEWVVFDIDGLKGVNTAEEFIRETLPRPFHNASYIAQMSCSSGITGTDLRLHLFFLLDKSVAPGKIKRWLTECNLDTPLLRDQLRLGAGGMSLRFPLDRSVADNSKLIFIAPPMCSNFSDPLAGQRISLVNKAHERVTFDFTSSSQGVISDKEKDAIGELHDKDGLEKKRYSVRKEGEYHVLKNADPIEVTDHWERNGFIRLNINGGDSGAYYITPGHYKYIHNFKGEPSLLTKEVAPEFYRELQDKYGKPDMLVFRDIITDKFYCGMYRPDDDVIDYLYQAKEGSLEDWAEDLFNASLPDPMPQYNLIFDPTIGKTVDRAARTVNWFWPTDYMRLEVPDAELTAIPETIERVLRHVTGNDDEAFEWVINWLAYIFQFRDKAGTAVVVQGVPGTGKGIFYEQILRNLFGQYTREVSLDKIEQDLFNSFLDKSLIIHINEAQANEKMRNQMFMWITDHFTSVRRAYQEQQDVRTFCNFILSSNHHNAVRIEKLDRRYTVCPWQELPLYTSAEKAAGRPIEDIAAIRKGLHAFAKFLLAYEVDEMMAHTPLENEAKADMRVDAGNSLDDFAEAVNDGNLDYFLEMFILQQQTTNAFSLNVDVTLKRWAEKVNTGEETPVGMNEMRLMYQYIQAKPVAAGRFSHLLTNINVRRRKRVMVGGKMQDGLMVAWRCDPALLNSCKDVLGGIKAPIVDTGDPADRSVLSMKRPE